MNDPARLPQAGENPQAARYAWQVMPYALQAPVHSELVIKKSRFIGCVESVPDRAAALARVAQLHAEHPTPRTSAGADGWRPVGSPTAHREAETAKAHRG